MKSSRVTVESRLTAVSSEPVSPGTTHPFSALDHAMGMHTLHVIFYYRTNPFGSFDLNPARVTLSEALSMFPPVTGRLARREDGNWGVKCNDAGVRVLRAKVRATLDEWLRSADAAEERDLTAWDAMPEDPALWSPFRIQISEFDEGGVAVGVSCLHMHADPTSVTLLFNSWTQVHRHRPLAFSPIFRPSALLLRGPPASTDHYYAAKSKSTSQPPSPHPPSTATFSFSHSAINQLLQKFPRATAFSFLAALFWTQVARLKQPEQSHGGRLYSLSVCLDFRNKLMQTETETETPLPNGYFGNALNFSQLVLPEEEMTGSELEDVVRMVQSHVSGLRDQEFRSGLEWLESRKEEGGRFKPPFSMYGPELTCVSMEHTITPDNESLMYAAAFEDDGKPVHVSYQIGNEEGEGLIVVMPSPEGGLARRVAVTLPADEMTKLCEDEAILNLKPKMLLSGGREL